MVYAVHSSVAAVWSITSMFLEQFFSLFLPCFSVVVSRNPSSILIYENVQMTCHYNNTQAVYTYFITSSSSCTRLWSLIRTVWYTFVVGGHPHNWTRVGPRPCPAGSRSYRWQGKRNFRPGLCPELRKEWRIGLTLYLE